MNKQQALELVRQHELAAFHFNHMIERLKVREAISDEDKEFLEAAQDWLDDYVKWKDGL